MEPFLEAYVEPFLEAYVEPFLDSLLASPGSGCSRPISSPKANPPRKTKEINPQSSLHGSAFSSSQQLVTSSVTLSAHSSSSALNTSKSNKDFVNLQEMKDMSKFLLVTAVTAVEESTSQDNEVYHVELTSSGRNNLSLIHI